MTGSSLVQFQDVPQVFLTGTSVKSHWSNQINYTDEVNKGLENWGKEN